MRIPQGWNRGPARPNASLPAAMNFALKKLPPAEADERAAVGAMRNMVKERAGIIDSPLTNPSHFYDLTPLPSVLESRCLK